MYIEANTTLVWIWSFHVYLCLCLLVEVCFLLAVLLHLLLAVTTGVGGLQAQVALTC